MRRLRLLPLLLLASCVSPAGSAGETAMLGDVPIQVFTYQPKDCTPTGILVVFAGLERNAGPYRDFAIPLAQRTCMIVVAPLFDKARFPSWRYQRGGIVHDGAVQPPASWTVAYVPQLIAWARAKLARTDLPVALIGHSAGAQFLSRVAAYEPVDAVRIVIANPSTWVRARLDVPAPYGFGGVSDSLQRYLALPITVLLGGADTGSRNLVENEEAEAQGSTRLQRGETVFHEAEQVARQRGWPFNWRLAVAPGIGHDARAIFASDDAFAAFSPPPSSSPSR